MIFEDDLMLMSISIGIILMICGLIMYYFPPKKINSLYGYRTANSMKNQKRWDFAQKFSAKYMIFLGVVYMIITALFSFISLEKYQAVILGMGLLVFMIVILIVIVERKINNKFD